MRDQRRRVKKRERLSEFGRQVVRNRVRVRKRHLDKKGLRLRG